MSRTTIVLDTPSEEALEALSHHYQCSPSEAVRRVLAHHRTRALGNVPLEKQRRRRDALQKLVQLMDGHDWQSELLCLQDDET